MKKRTVAVMIAIGVIIGGAVMIGASYTLAWHLFTNGVKMESNGFRITDYDEFYFDKRRNIELTARKGDDMIRVKIIKGIGEAEARERIDGIFRTMNAHFEPQEILGIYADLIAAVAKVPDELKPKQGTVRIMNEDVRYFKAFADRYVSYMVMTHDQVQYEGVVTLIYCPKQSELVNIELLAPRESFDMTWAQKQLESFTCKK